MSYITNPKALRLGFTQTWDTNSLQQEKDLHLSRKIRLYLKSIFNISSKKRYFPKTLGRIPVYVKKENTDILFFKKYKNKAWSFKRYLINSVVNRYKIKKDFIFYRGKLKDDYTKSEKLIRVPKYIFDKKEKKFSLKKNLNKLPENVVKLLKIKWYFSRNNKKILFSRLSRSFSPFYDFSKIAYNLVKMYRKTKIRVKGNALETLISNMIIGSVLVQSKTGYIKVYMNIYFDMLNAYSKFEKIVKRKLFLFKRNLAYWLGMNVDLYIVNNYLFFWEMSVFFNRKELFRDKNLQFKLKTIIFRNQYMQHRRRYFKYYKRFIFSYFSRYKKLFGANRFFHNTAPAILVLFIFHFDVQMLATIISQELARLRHFHRKYVRFITATLNYGFRFYGRKYLKGIEVRLKGQITWASRRMKRSQFKRIRIGKITRSNLGKSVSYAQEVSVTRFGTIGVSISCEHKEINKIVKKDSLELYNADVYFRNLINSDLNFVTNYDRYQDIFENYSSNKESYLFQYDLAQSWSRYKYYNYLYFNKYKMKIFKTCYNLDFGPDNIKRFNRLDSSFLKEDVYSFKEKIYLKNEVKFNHLNRSLFSNYFENLGVNTSFY